MKDDADKPVYEVGYGKPPEDSRFKKGQSGNPSGKPKGAKSWQTLIKEVLNERITINVNGKRRWMLRKRALAIHAANLAMTKNDLTMLKAMRAFDEPPEAPQQPAEDENIPWRCTLVFDNEPQLTYENGEVVIDHRGARYKDTDESEWW